MTVMYFFFTIEIFIYTYEQQRDIMF